MKSSRRSMLKATGFAGMMGGCFDRLWADSRPTSPFKRCVVLWMGGGPSQQDTFDPKESSPADRFRRRSMASGLPRPCPEWRSEPRIFVWSGRSEAEKASTTARPS